MFDSLMQHRVVVFDADDVRDGTKREHTTLLRSTSPFHRDASFGQMLSTERSLQARRDDRSAVASASVVARFDPSRQVVHSSYPVIGLESPETRRQ